MEGIHLTMILITDMNAYRHVINSFNPKERSKYHTG